MRLSPGTRLGPYEIVTPIGAGGMGEVYRARDTRLDRDVAIKVLPSAVASDPDRLARFEREARVLASINHPHIATVFGFEESAAGTALVMELVDGETLQSPLPPAEALRVAIQIATALEAAHERGITHRDLKPANIMVTRTGIKLLDFGLARSTTGDGQPSVTQTEAGTIVGTACYMSPEQAEGRPVDVRSDIFSFGALLYEMMSGVQAFPGDSTASTLASVLRDEPAPIQAPSGVQSIVNRCLRKAPADRFQSAAALKTALEEAAVSAGRNEAAGARSFWIAVAPLKYTGTELAPLAEGVSEEIVAGLSRFSYLRVLTRESSASARYLIEGSLRQAGSQLRATVQLSDIATGARLWAETYNRSYSPDAIFETQDSLVAPIVASIAEWGGALVHNMLMALRDRDPRTLTPYEALLRSSGWSELLSPEETRIALEVLNRATEREPNHSGCLAMLAMVHGYGYLFSFSDNPKSRDLCLSYARRAVAADANDHLAFYALGLAHSCFKDIAAFRNAADRALALNPLDGSIMAHVGMWTAYNGDWERGCGLVQRAMSLNPRHKGWYWFPLAHDAYRRHDYAAALQCALRVNLPGQFWTHELLARTHAQLGNQAAAAQALEELLALRPDFLVNARQELEKWFVESSVVEDMLEGLRKAGLQLDRDAPERASSPRPASAPKPASAVTPPPSIAVLPFANLSADQEQQYFGDGLAEEILNALMQVPGLRVIARASAFAFRGHENAIAEIGDRLKVTHVLHGSVRRADSRIRVTAQLIHVSDETQLWAERYDRELRDVFDIQDEIAQAIVAQLKVRLGARADAPLVKRYTENVEAHNLYLRGTFHVHRLTNSEVQRGRDFLEKAVDLDPRYAPALFELAGYYVAMGHRGGVACRAVGEGPCTGKESNRGRPNLCGRARDAGLHGIRLRFRMEGWPAPAGWGASAESSLRDSSFVALQYPVRHRLGRRGGGCDRGWGASRSASRNPAYVSRDLCAPGRSA